MSRRCLICANINPCREHSSSAQDAELSRNQRAIREIENFSRQPEKTDHAMIRFATDTQPVAGGGE